MSYFIENWIRGKDADIFRKLSAETGQYYYPHVTLVRPFTPNSSEDEVKELITGTCKGQTPIPFSLEGFGSFGEVKYIPVVSSELLHFAEVLEDALAPKVKFVKKLGDQKTLHLTIDAAGQADPFPQTNFHMLRLTAIRNKFIWFSYDFVTGEVLNREETLDKERWAKTVNQFYGSPLV